MSLSLSFTHTDTLTHPNTHLLDSAAEAHTQTGTPSTKAVGWSKSRWAPKHKTYRWRDASRGNRYGIGVHLVVLLQWISQSAHTNVCIQILEGIMRQSCIRGKERKSTFVLTGSPKAGVRLNYVLTPYLIWCSYSVRHQWIGVAGMRVWECRRPQSETVEVGDGPKRLPWSPPWTNCHKLWSACRWCHPSNHTRV
jgi:hypothetical protein